MNLMQAILTEYGPIDGNRIRKVFENACICTFDDLDNLPGLVQTKLCGDDVYTLTVKLRKLEKEPFREEI